ncbi:MAG: outer membrane beta-barrel protein [Bacteroidia bacterium]
MSVFRINKSPGEERSDKGLRDKLNAHSVTPPSYIWDNVEENLPQKRKRRGFIFWLMPLAACIAGLAGLLYILLPENTSKLAQQKTEKITPSTGNNKNYDKLEQDEKKADPLIASQQDNHDATTENINSQSDKEPKNNSIASQQDIKKSDSRIRKLTNNQFQNKKSSAKEYARNSASENKKAEFKDSNIADLKPENNEAAAENKLMQENTIAAVDSSALKDSLVAENKQIAVTKPEIKNPETIKKPVTNTNDSKWAIGADLGIGASYRFINQGIGLQNDMMPDSGGPVMLSSNSTDYNKVESTGFSWAGGLNVRYSLSDNWSLLSGLNYTHTSIRSKINTLSYITYDSPYEPRDTTYIQKNSTGEFNYIEIDALVLDQTGGPITNNNDPVAVSQEANIRYSFNFIDVPLQIQYRTSAKKVAWFVQGGPSFRFLKGKKAVYSVNSGSADVTLSQAYHTFAVSANLTSGITIPVKNFDIQIGPSFSMWLTPLMKSEPKTHLYTAHLKSAIYYNF